MREVNFQCKAAPNGTPEIFVYDDIGPDWAGMISGETVVRALSLIGPVKDITVRLNSPGGDVFQGFAIYNALVRHPAKITIEIDGLAASAASLIAMAGDTVRIAENAMVMIHNCWTVALGNCEELRKQAGILEDIDDAIVNTYAARTGLGADDLRAMMLAETWLGSADSIEKGFCDEVGQKLQVSARVSAGRFKNTPEHLLAELPPVQREAKTEAPATPPRLAARLAALKNEVMRRKYQI